METKELLFMLLSLVCAGAIVFVLYKAYKIAKELLKIIDSFFGNINR